MNHRAILKVASERVGAVYLERCPIHGELVSLDRNFSLLGCCQGCATAAATGIAWLAAHPYDTTTGPGRSILADIAPRARQGEL